MPDGPADAVLVGFTREFDYDGLRRANATIRRWGALIGSNDDATYPTPEGPDPRRRALLAAVATASGRGARGGRQAAPTMADLVRAELGGVVDGAVMIGDRPETDGEFAVQLGIPSRWSVPG